MLALACALPMMMTACATSARPIPKVHADIIRVTVLDAASGKPIAKTEVHVYSDNGVRCIRAPCPTNAKDWKGHTDGNGVFKLPSTVVQQSMTLTATGHTRGKDLSRDASKPKANEWVISLDPDR